MNNLFKCPLCGAEEVLKRQIPLGRKSGFMFKFYFIHHECELGHQFHSPSPNTLG